MNASRAAVSLGPLDLARRLDEALAVYEAAFQRHAPERRTAFERHAAKAGYCGAAGFGAGGAMVAIAYGYLAHAGDWWSDTVRPHLADAGRLAAMVDAFAIAEVAVMPAYQGRGMGGRVLDELLRRVEAPRVLLGVYTDNAVARHVYEKRGFVVLTAPFRFFAADRPYVVMGASRSPRHGGT
jgi:ribosomal protein S18 acetylase RimI-like enzyme